MRERELRCYDYVNRPYALVREALVRDALGIFQRATNAASTRADELAANLHVSMGPLEVGADVVIQVVEVSEGTSPFNAPMTSLGLAWQAARGAALFPAMQATLAIYALTKNDTQLDLHGFYRPPLGLFGSALDAVAGHRLAEATVLTFVQEVAGYLRANL